MMFGNKAVKKAMNLFYPDNKKEANDWISIWTAKERSESVFFIVKRKLRTNTVVYFKFVIGDSVLGEIEKDLDSGMKKLKSI